jgi:hypothetical protein
MSQPLSLYIDGGIKCNNPISMVHFEASMIWPNRINNAFVISTKARGVENVHLPKCEEHQIATFRKSYQISIERPKLLKSALHNKNEADLALAKVL